MRRCSSAQRANPACMETMGDMRRNGIERLLVILGASGSGKSSFMRAGLLPRLARDDRQFFPLPVIRPPQPLCCSARMGWPPPSLPPSPGWAVTSRWERSNRAQRGRKPSTPCWRHLEQRLLDRIAGEAEPQPPSLVLLIDQAEEFFNYRRRRRGRDFLSLLAAC